MTGRPGSFARLRVAAAGGQLVARRLRSDVGVLDMDTFFRGIAAVMPLPKAGILANVDHIAGAGRSPHQGELPDPATNFHDVLQVQLVVKDATDQAQLAQAANGTVGILTRPTEGRQEHCAQRP